MTLGLGAWDGAWDDSSWCRAGQSAHVPGQQLLILIPAKDPGQSFSQEPPDPLGDSTTCWAVTDSSSPVAHQKVDRQGVGSLS